MKPGKEPAGQLEVAAAMHLAKSFFDAWRSAVTLGNTILTARHCRR
jgi:hypothetical protein